MGNRIRRPVEPQQPTEGQYTPEELESHGLAQAEIGFATVKEAHF